MGEVIRLSFADMSFWFSVIGALSGAAGFAGFLFTIISERANVVLSGFSERGETYNAFFRNRFKGWITKFNAFARVQISNNSKLPICIVDVKFKYRGVEYRASIRKAEHTCRFVLGEHDGEKVISEFEIAEEQIMFPVVIEPYGFIEGILFFHIFPDLPEDKDFMVPIEFVTNRKKSYFLNTTFVSEPHLNQIRLSDWKEKRETAKQR